MLACTGGGHLHDAVSKGMASHRLMVALLGTPQAASATYEGKQHDQLITGATPLLSSLAGRLAGGRPC